MSNFKSDPYLKLYIAGAIFVFTILIILDFIFLNDLKDILIEAHGLFFDILFFGLIYTAFASRIEKRRKIERYKDEIDDYRFWMEEQATYRIVGLIKRLNKLNVSNIRLDYCNLKEAALWETNLKGSSFIEANMEKVYLRKSIVTNCNFSNAKLINSYLISADFSYSIFFNCDLSGADLRNANFFRADFNSIKSLSGAKVDDLRWIENLKKSEVKGFEHIKNNYYVDKKPNLGKTAHGFEYTFYLLKEKRHKKLYNNA